MLQNDKYLITGGNGFLGNVLTGSLKKMGLEVYLLGRSANNNYVYDIAKPFKFHDDDQFNIVVHAAGKAHAVPKTNAEEQEFFNVNFVGTQNLCTALSLLKIKPEGFVFISSVSVYGVEEGELIGEEHALNGKTPYARSKIMAEQWLHEWAQNNGIKLSILRLPLVAGVNPPGNLGAMINGIRNGKYLRIGNASAKKSMVLAEDVAKILPLLAKIGGTFNLTDRVNPTFGELEDRISLILRVKKVRKISYSLAFLLAKFGDLMGNYAPLNSDKLNKIVSTLTFDDSKASKVLNWKPTSVLDKLPDLI